jgi:hypothetical protein
LKNGQVIALLGIAVGLCGIYLVAVSSLRKIARTGEWTKWRLTRQSSSYSERRLWLVGWALTLAGMVLMWVGSGIRW